MNNGLAYWSAGGASARGSIKRIFCPLMLAGVLLVFLCVLPKSARAASNLTWQGIPLNQANGFCTGCGPSIAKGFALPLTVGSGVFDFQVPQWGPAPVGAVAPGSWLFFDDVIYATAGSLKDADGRNVADGIPHKLDETANLIQAIWFYPWQPDPHVLPFTYLIFPSFVTAHVSTSGTSSGGIGGGVGAGGIGDILWEPLGLAFLFTDSQFAHYFKVQSNAEFFIQFPSGNYSTQDSFNLGSNVYGFLPLTETWIQPGDYFGPWLSKLSWNFDAGYFISEGNSKFVMPITVTPPGGPTLAAGSLQDYKTGQVFIWDNDFWYNLYKGFSLGLTVNWLEQATNDTLAGHSISNTGQEMISVGPSAFLSLGSWSGFIKIPFNVHTVNEYSLTEVQATVAYFW
jgi:hypothetical protein